MCNGYYFFKFNLIDNLLTIVKYHDFIFSEIKLKHDQIAHFFFVFKRDKYYLYCCGLSGSLTRLYAIIQEGCGT